MPSSSASSLRILQNPLKFYFLPSNCPKLNKARQALAGRINRESEPAVGSGMKRLKPKIHNNNKRRQQTNKRQSFWRRTATEIKGNTQKLPLTNPTVGWGWGWGWGWVWGGVDELRNRLKVIGTDFGTT